MQNNIENDQRIIMTLDAGGTNFVFSAMQGNSEIVEAINLPPNADNLELCLATIISGFKQVKEQLSSAPSAISFAFPGPADYPNGIIGNLPNLPAFRGGIALGPMLEEEFDIPVFINNDGNLFVYGEALYGFLPAVNEILEENASPKRFKNLIGITLGTGFGVGIVTNKQLLVGDNSNGGEGWLLRDVLQTNTNVEEHLSRDGIRRAYASKAQVSLEQVESPYYVYKVAKGEEEGNKSAAIEVYNDFGSVLGEALATVVTLVDGLVVLGGGVAAAYDLFAPAMLAQMESKFQLADGEKMPRLVQRVFDLETETGMDSLATGNATELKIPGTEKTMLYDAFVRTGVGRAKFDTGRSIALGAYAFALHQLDN